MILAIDTNVLLDILIPNTAHVETSLRCLTSIKPNDNLIICEVVFAELGSQFLSFNDLSNQTKTPFSKPALPGKNTLPVKKVRFCALLVVNNKKLPVLTAMKLFFTASTF